MTTDLPFPFTAVVGQDDLKTALLLNALDPSIGGVLLRGEKGSAKSTLARGLAALLPGGAPFVELPLGASEDRLVGTIDIKAALTAGERRFQAGLLHAAHGGVLYVDEVNLLPDHLVDLLLDVAASGVNRVEREGMSHSHPSRFVLVGSMNPEEGELRPQLLDRFGLAVDVTASTDPDERAEAVRRRLAFDADPKAFFREWGRSEDKLRARLQGLAFAGGSGERQKDSRLHGAPLPAELRRAVSVLCAGVGVEGLRADLVICRGAAALARWEGRSAASLEDVRRVAVMALAHRRRRGPFDEPGIDPAEVDAALPSAETPDNAPEGRRDAVEPAVAAAPALDAGPVVAPSVRPGAPGRHGPEAGRRGRLVGDRPWAESSSAVAVPATLAAAATRRGIAGSAALLEPEDLREALREQRRAHLVVLVVDASASMGAPARMEAAKGAVMSLLLDAYQRRDRVALVAFSGDDARVLLRPTGSVEVARARLRELPTGGRTPLAAGLRTGLSLVQGAEQGSYLPLLVLVSDGRATGPAGKDDPLGESLRAASELRRRKVRSVVVDAEEGPGRLQLASRLAEAMGARHVRLADLSAEALTAVVTEELRSCG